jgi:hypothetical protein
VGTAVDDTAATEGVGQFSQAATRSLLCLPGKAIPKPGNAGIYLLAILPGGGLLAQHGGHLRQPLPQPIRAPDRGVKALAEGHRVGRFRDPYLLGARQENLGGHFQLLQIRTTGGFKLFAVHGQMLVAEV